ncbi:hypothetical protein Tco_0404953 [Tanacetum coccineum]
MADNDMKPTTNEFATNDQANYYSGITNIKVNGKNTYELKGKLFDDLHKNAFSGTKGGDAVEHIEYFLKIFDPIDLPYVNQDKLRVVVFPISLIETDVFDYESPLYMAFNEFIYLLKVVPKLFTYDVERTENYDDYMNEFNDEFEEPWDEDDVPYKIGDHICEPFHFKNRKTKWPTCSSNEDGFCNDEVLEQKAIYEESWSDAKQSVTNFFGWLKRTFGNFHELDYGLLDKLQYYWWEVNEHKKSPFANWKNHLRGPYANFFGTRVPYLDISHIFDMNGDTSHFNDHDVNEQEVEERCEVFDQEQLVCNIRIFEMIKYSFGDGVKYVAIKEDEYDDLTSTSKEHATHTKKSFARWTKDGW